MRESDGDKRRYLKMAAAILLALVLVCSVFIIVFSSISSTSSRYSESETYSGNVVAGEHDLDHTGWLDFNEAFNKWYEEYENSDNIMQFSPSGKYFLSSDLVVSMSIQVNLSEGDEFTLCLNGHSLSITTKYHDTVIRFYGEYATFNLYDCGGETVNTHYYKLSNDFGVSYLADYLLFYDFSVTDEEISQIKSGQIEGGCIEGGLISGGSILGDYHPGGIEIGKNSTFNMYGGTIAGNWTDDDGYGGGVYVENAAVFNMYGGSIEGNANGYFKNERRSGGGVLVGGKFNMYGGTISNNYAKAGGGVELSMYYNCSFNMYDGIISNNYAEEGGGVEVNSGKFSMHGGTISNNYAEEGGGVFAYEFYSDYENEGYNSDMFEMDGGTIAYNQATNGGGVYLRDVDFKMNGGEIEYNVATADGESFVGGGVYTDMTGSIVLTGAPYIYDNYRRTSEDDENPVQCNLAQDADSDTDQSKYLIIYVADEAQYTEDDELQEGSKIGVTLPEEITRVTWNARDSKDAPGYDSGSELKTIAGYFVSDDDSYEVVETESGTTYWLALQQKT